MPPFQRTDARARREWWIATVVLQAVMLWFTFIGVGERGAIIIEIPHPVPAVAILCVCVSSLLRSRRPAVFLLVAAVADSIAIGGEPIEFPGFGFRLGTLAALYAVANAYPLKAVVIVASALSAVQTVIALTVRGAALMSLHGITITATAALAVAIGHAMRTRRQLWEETHLRATEMERTRRAEGAASLAKEKLAIARDLHDVIGHQIAVINMHAAAATRAIITTPSKALTSLDVIQTSASVALRDISDFLTTLRGDRSEPMAPRDLRDLEETVQTLRAADARIVPEIDAEVSALPSQISRGAYLIAREGLVNAYKYGTPRHPIFVRVSVRRSLLDIAIVNDVGPDESRSYSSSIGIGDIRERTKTLGGTSSVVSDESRHFLHVLLPIPERSA
ncbi:MAG: histidine kinase [Microbacterium sp.]